MKNISRSLYVYDIFYLQNEEETKETSLVQKIDKSFVDPALFPGMEKCYRRLTQVNNQ